MVSDAAVQAATLVPTDAEASAVDAARAYVRAVRRVDRARIVSMLRDKGQEYAAELVRAMPDGDEW